jgi:putative SOS response-associated peptidase YedK
MCGRCIQLSPEQMIAYLRRLYPDVPLDQLLMEPRYNIPPSKPLLVVGETSAGRFAESMKWGLVPSWAKDPSIGNKMANAKLETAAEKPSFRTAMKHRRCLIFVSGFYEWHGAKAPKQPFYIYRADGEPMVFAGLWETWQQPDGTPLHTCTILTREPNALMATVHNRMPVILEHADFERWIDPKMKTALEPAVTAEDVLRMHPVSRAVNSPANSGSECIAPIAA